MGSANTFVRKVVELLRGINQRKRMNIQVLFTGYYLGSWLAYITTLTKKYLKFGGNNFLVSDNVPQSYHPHKAVFDSPIC